MALRTSGSSSTVSKIGLLMESAWLAYYRSRLDRQRRVVVITPSRERRLAKVNLVAQVAYVGGECSEPIYRAGRIAAAEIRRHLELSRRFGERSWISCCTTRR